MKKIVMCVNYPMNNPSIGISKKIRSQIESFEKLGYEVTYTAYIDNGIGIFCGDKMVRSVTFNKLIPYSVYSIFRFSMLLGLLRDYLRSNSNNYDMGFIRWNAVTPKYISLLKEMKQNCRHIIMDCHGYHPGFNPRTIKGQYIKCFTNANSYRLKQYIDLCLLEAKDNKVWDIPALPIDTGIDVDKYEPNEYAGNKDELHMISVANELPYHGYDRLIKGIHLYHGKRKVVLHLVGKMNKKTIALVKKLNLEDVVYLHGYQTGDDLKRIYKQCNMGVGPLAPHRSGGKQGTGIKTKEYFALGLPYFYAGQELLVPDGFPYVYKCDDSETPIDIESILMFYDNIKKDEGISLLMRTFARDNYSWTNIFSKVEDLLFDKTIK